MLKSAERLKIGDFIFRRQPFVVPKYQRAYAWPQDEVRDYISDLRSLVEARTAGSPKAHFFGAIVCVEQQTPGSSAGRSLEVVDGQQRLATFMITLSQVFAALNTLSQEAKALGDSQVEHDAAEHAKTMARDFLYYTEIETGQSHERSRLALSKADRAFFEAILKNAACKPERESHHLLLGARNEIATGLTQALTVKCATPAEKLKQLLEIKDAVTEDCYVVFITSEDRNSAYTLFTVLNDRGKSLSEGDLLRAHTLELLEGHGAQQDAVERLWDDVLSRSETEIAKYLAAYYASKAGERANERKLYHSFVEVDYKDLKSPVTAAVAASVLDEVTELRREFKIFESLAEGEWPYVPPTAKAWDQDRLRRLVGVMKHTLSIPLLLAAARFLEEQKFVSLVDVLERFVFRYIVIVGAHPGRVAVVYYRYAKEIRSAPSAFVVNEVRKDLKKILDKHASGDLFISGLEAKLEYSRSSSQNRLIKHFLSTIDDHLPWFRKGAKQPPKPDKMNVYDINLATVEHIYPQSAAVKDLALEPVKHRIGNLSFWAQNDNSSAGNALLASKTQAYRSSSVRLNRELSKLNGWTKAEYDNRQKELGEIALKVFDL